MVKRALLVGCNYPGKKYALYGCVNDVRVIKGLLIERFGFPPENIKVMLDAETAYPDPTGEAIKQSLTSLCEAAVAGDVIVFHFSGHGTQVPSDDLITVEIDGKDSALVPSDLNLIVDDDLRDIVSKCGPDVRFTMIADCCNSGGLLDGLEVPIAGDKELDDDKVLIVCPSKDAHSKGASSSPHAKSGARDIDVSLIAASDLKLTAEVAATNSTPLTVSETPNSSPLTAEVTPTNSTPLTVTTPNSTPVTVTTPNSTPLTVSTPNSTPLTVSTPNSTPATVAAAAVEQLEDEIVEEDEGLGVGVKGRSRFLGLNSLLHGLGDKIGHLVHVGEIRPTLHELFGDSASNMVGTYFGSGGATNGGDNVSNEVTPVPAKKTGGITSSSASSSQASGPPVKDRSDLAGVAVQLPPEEAANPSIGVLITGCQRFEKSADACPTGDPAEAFGALTNAIVMLHKEHPDVTFTNRQLVYEVRDVLQHMNYSQNPCLEASEQNADLPFIC